MSVRLEKLKTRKRTLVEYPVHQAFVAMLEQQFDMVFILDFMERKLPPGFLQPHEKGSRPMRPNPGISIRIRRASDVVMRRFTTRIDKKSAAFWPLLQTR